MTRGEIYNARLDPTEGSEHSGSRPVIFVRRDAINANSPLVLVVPCTADGGQRIYPSHTRLSAGEGGLHQDSIAMGEQVRPIDKRRLGEFLGNLPSPGLRRLDRALMIALELPGDL